MPNKRIYQKQNFQNCLEQNLQNFKMNRMDCLYPHSENSFILKILMLTTIRKNLKGIGYEF